MDVTLQPSPLKGSVTIPASKSLSHRYLIAASLAQETSTINGLLDSDDIQTTKTALRALNATINNESITGAFPKKNANIINANASGSTLRFIIPICMLQAEPIQITGKDRLPMRSLSVYETLFQGLKYHYKRLGEHHLPIEVKGPLKPLETTIRGDVSSQFISGLLFALPLCDGPSKITVTEPFESQDYVNLTLEVLKTFDVHITREENTFVIPGNQTYRAIDATIEGDYSSASFFIVAALINKNPLQLNNLSLNSNQGDKAIVDIVEKMGGKITRETNHLTVYPSSTKGIDIDLANIPDSGPILMILAALSEGKTTFHNINRLRYKESDRIEAMHQTLDKFNVKHTITKDTMTIEGQDSLPGNLTFETFEDHRIAMALAVASIKCDGPITIKNIEVINKSYPTFLQHFSALGGTWKEAVKTNE